MKKEKLELEYPLKSTSINILWNAIGTSYGLSEWFADDVNISENEYVFTWDGYGETALLLEVKPLEYIRFQWKDDEDADGYFEMRIVKHELSSDLNLLVTLFVEPEEKDDEMLLWDKHVEALRRKIGI